MSQARTIYEFLGRTTNPAANRVLLLGLRMAEPPYNNAILETILDRGEASTTAELIRGYHSFPPQWQRVICERVEDIYLGLQHVWSVQAEESVQTKLNMLSVIRKARYRRQVELVGAMLRDHNEQVAESAGEVLIELARPSGQDEDTTDEQIMSVALQRGIAQYNKLHYREEAILAAMYFATADMEHFWKDYLEPYHIVGQKVRQFLMSYDRPELARFCAGAMGHKGLKTTAVRAIAMHKDNDYILAIARQIQSSNNDKTNEVLKRIKNPLWLRRDRLAIDSFNSEDQAVLFGFITSLGVEKERLGDYLCSFVGGMSEVVLLSSVEFLCDQPERKIDEPIKAIMQRRVEKTALAVLGVLISRKPNGLPRIMAEQLNSPRQYIHNVARSYFQKIAFDSYWKRFEEMLPEGRVTAGRAVFKIDPDALERWGRYACSIRSGERMRAIRMARSLGMVDRCEGVLRGLAGDPDRMVRSCAVASLGEIAVSFNDTVEECLLGSLRDADPRVCANAIEALERRGAESVVEDIKPLVRSENNRVRANAIKVLLGCRVSSARLAIGDMLNDRRRRHRRSAVWVAKHISIEYHNMPKTKNEEIDSQVCQVKLI